MIQSRTTGFNNALFLSSCLVVFATFWGVFGFVSLAIHSPGGMDPMRYVEYSFLTTLTFYLENLLSTRERFDLVSRDAFRAIKRGLQQTLVVGGVFLVVVLLLRDLAISRSFLFLFIPALAITLSVSNSVLPAALSNFFFSPRNQARILLIGNPKRVKKIHRWASRMARFGLKISGVLTDATARKTVYRIPVLGGISDLSEVIKDHRIDLLMLLETPDSPEELQKILKISEKTGTRLISLNTLAETYQHSLQYIHHYGLDFITIRSEPLQDPLIRVLKRAVDVTIALPIVIFVLPPIIAMVAIAQRLQSPGPIFFRQFRSGIQTTRFEILKFRTMTCINDDPARQASRQDSRIYGFGRFLRKTSLDEFPQFVNVLRGEMSIVGPRPHMIEHDQKFARVMQSYQVRSLVKPGITGLAQIRGYRGEANTEEAIRLRVGCDIEYIEQYSLFLDFYIILRTVFAVMFPPRTAY